VRRIGTDGKLLSARTTNGVIDVDDLFAFVRRLVDEDERVALAASDGDPSWVIRKPEPGDPSWYSPTLLGKSLISSCDPATLTPEEGEHIARWDPARVLAEVKAKRRMLDRCEHDLRSFVGSPAQVATSYLVVKQLAQPYAGQDGWREEWRA
jgi:hypothetical protein